MSSTDSLAFQCSHLYLRVDFRQNYNEIIWLHSGQKNQEKFVLFPTFAWFSYRSIPLHFPFEDAFRYFLVTESWFVAMADVFWGVGNSSIRRTPVVNATLIRYNWNIVTNFFARVQWLRPRPRDTCDCLKRGDRIAGLLMDWLLGLEHKKVDGHYKNTCRWSKIW